MRQQWVRPLKTLCVGIKCDVPTSRETCLHCFEIAASWAETYLISVSSLLWRADIPCTLRKQGPGSVKVRKHGVNVILQGHVPCGTYHGTHVTNISHAQPLKT